MSEKEPLPFEEIKETFKDFGEESKGVFSDFNKGVEKEPLKEYETLKEEEERKAKEKERIEQPGIFNKNVLDDNFTNWKSFLEEQIKLNYYEESESERKKALKTAKEITDFLPLIDHVGSDLDFINPEERIVPIMRNVLSQKALLSIEQIEERGIRKSFWKAGHTSSEDKELGLHRFVFSGLGKTAGFLTEKGLITFIINPFVLEKNTTLVSLYDVVISAGDKEFYKSINFKGKDFKKLMPLFLLSCYFQPQDYLLESGSKDAKSSYRPLLYPHYPKGWEGWSLNNLNPEIKTRDEISLNEILGIKIAPELKKYFQEKQPKIWEGINKLFDKNKIIVAGYKSPEEYFQYCKKKITGNDNIPCYKRERKIKEELF